MDAKALIAAAVEAMGHAYAPYSGYKVGAALLCADGTVYGGCNIENGSYGATNCAERTAFFKAVYDGHRDFSAFPMCSHPAASAARSCGNSVRTISKSILWGRTVPIWSGPWPSSCRTASAPRPICKSRYKPHISLLIFLAECAIMESVGKPTQIT